MLNKPGFHPILISLFCGCSIAVALASIQSTRLSQLLSPAQSYSPTQLRVQQQVEAEKLRILSEAPSFGFGNLVANGTFLNFLQYFGDSSKRSEVGYTLSPYFFEVIVNRDPFFIQSYFYLSHSVSIYSAQPERAISLIETGLETLAPNIPPDSYIVWRYKAIDELLFLGDSAAARNSFKTAADWADQSEHSEAEEISAISRRTASFLENNPSSRAAQIDAWAQVLVRAIDDYTVSIATENIESLGGRIILAGEGRVSVRYSIDDEI